MPEAQHTESTFCPGCVDAAGAWIWVDVVADTALEGDEDAIATLGIVIDHWLAVRHAELAT